MTIWQRGNKLTTAGIITGITLGITIAGFIIGIIKTTSGISVDFGKMKQRLDNNEARDTEERAHASTKFSELYTRTSEHEAALSKLTTKVDNIDLTTQKMDAKLDRLIEKSYGEQKK